MLPARFRSRIHAIAADRKSGAIELGIEVVKAFELLSHSGRLPAEGEILGAAKFLSRAQPSMVPIHNVAEMCSEIIAGEGEVSSRLQKLREFLEESRKRVATNFMDVPPSHATAMTISRSSTVIESLRMAAASGRVCKVYVLESRPRLEGVATARELSRFGIECILIADASGPSTVAHVDIVVVGADAILRDGSVVNKIGTYSLALACRQAGTRFVVLTESVKLDRRYDSSTWPGSETRDEAELLPKPPRGLRALNKYFDLTPSPLVKTVVHDGGISRRSWAASMEKTMRRH